jgi:hypothetical protein
MWCASIAFMTGVGVALGMDMATACVVVSVAATMPVIYVVFSVCTLPQTISVRDGVVEITLPTQRLRFAFEACRWTISGNIENKAWYPVSQLLWLTPAIVLEVPDHGNRRVFYLCVDEASRRVWIEFLRLAAPESVE